MRCDVHAVTKEQNLGDTFVLFDVAVRLATQHGFFCKQAEIVILLE